MVATKRKYIEGFSRIAVPIKLCSFSSAKEKKEWLRVPDDEYRQERGRTSLSKRLLRLNRLDEDRQGARARGRRL